MTLREAFILLINWHIEPSVHKLGYLASSSKIQAACHHPYC